METEIVKSEGLQLTNPTDIMKVANILKDFISKNKLSCQIQGKEYAYVDGWKFAGQNFGLTAIPSKPLNESNDKEIKYSCEVDIIQISTGKKISYGFAICSNKESKKKSFDEYAIASMAQTRAIGKAFRNLLGYIMNAAGFEATPAEEMEETKYHNKGIVSEEDIQITIDAVNECSDMKILVKMYNDLSPEMQSNKKVSTAFTNKKMEFKKSAK